MIDSKITEKIVQAALERVTSLKSYAILKYHQQYKPFGFHHYFIEIWVNEELIFKQTHVSTYKLYDEAAYSQLWERLLVTMIAAGVIQVIQTNEDISYHYKGKQ